MIQVPHFLMSMDQLTSSNNFIDFQILQKLQWSQADQLAISDANMTDINEGCTLKICSLFLIIKQRTLSWWNTGHRLGVGNP